LLVVDDDETNRKILSGRLEAEGHKVFVAKMDGGIGDD